jgi:hypothetical protein
VGSIAWLCEQSGTTPRGSSQRSPSVKGCSLRNARENARIVRAGHTGKKDVHLRPNQNLLIAAKKGG